MGGRKECGICSLGSNQHMCGLTLSLPVTDKHLLRQWPIISASLSSTRHYLPSPCIWKVSLLLKLLWSNLVLVLSLQYPLVLRQSSSPSSSHSPAASSLSSLFWPPRPLFSPKVLLLTRDASAALHSIMSPTSLFLPRSLSRTSGSHVKPSAGHLHRDGSGSRKPMPAHLSQMCSPTALIQGSQPTCLDGLELFGQISPLQALQSISFKILKILSVLLFHLHFSFTESSQILIILAWTPSSYLLPHTGASRRDMQLPRKSF